MATGVRCSAPGKVLIVGGYLILDRENKGLVISTTARFHSSVRYVEQEATEAKQTNLSDPLSVSILSPQFSSKNQIQILEDDNGCIRLSEEAEQTPVYIRLCLLLGLGLARAYGGDKVIPTKPFQIMLQADNDFYSQQQLVALKEFSLIFSSNA